MSSAYTPTRDQFLATVSPGDIVPVYREILADRLTPVSAFERLNDGEGAFLLESVEGGERLARFSFIGCGAYCRVRAKGGTAVVTDETGARSEPIAPGSDALTVVKRVLARNRFVETPGLPKFCGGAVGYIAYDFARQLERLPVSTADDLGVDDVSFMLPGSLVVFDHVKHRAKVVCLARVGASPRVDYDAATARVDNLVARLRAAATSSKPADSAPAGAAAASVSRDEYIAAVERAKEYIAAGDAFQVVPSVRFTVPVSAPSFELYRALRSINPSPYMYYLDFGCEQVVGSSPEILVTVGDGQVTVRPIAGTRPRGASPTEDAANEVDLLQDAKELAEHIMLVDLGRNDVGRVSEYGTVRVDELMVIERYSHVMHIVSNVTGRLRSDLDIFDALRASFPAGTLTGAPKVRAMEIIEELEPTRRGLYGGAAGYFSLNGDADFAIAIRTMLVKDGSARIQAGAGIVADSVPESEYDECCNKARALLAAVEMAHEGLE